MPISAQDALPVKKILENLYPDIRTTPYFESVSGGSINKCFRVILSDQLQFFLKVNDANLYPALFSCEKTGLEWIQKNGIRTPSILSQFNEANRQYLLLEWIPPGNKTIGFWKKFGQQLAALHQIHSPRFGFSDNNFIGSLHQSNSIHDNWVNFLIEERLKPQIRLAEKRKYLHSRHLSQFENLFSLLGQFFPQEKPSLLHGDLWSGNYLCDESSSPVLIDPALYFGHRSMDIGMTMLFGGFDKSFYEAYYYHLPVAVNFVEQCLIAQLYPLLVHLNLFGISYVTDIEEILNRINRAS